MIIKYALWVKVCTHSLIIFQDKFLEVGCVKECGHFSVLLCCHIVLWRSQHCFLLSLYRRTHLSPSGLHGSFLGSTSPSPSSGLLSFQFTYHSSAGLNSLEHKFIMSLNISDPCLPSGHDPHSSKPACHEGFHLRPSFLRCWFTITPGPPVLGEQRLRFHLYIPSTGLCPAHRESTRVLLQLVASPLTAHHDFIASFVSCKTNCYMSTWSHLPSDLIWS